MLKIDITPPIARVTLNRPESHNAFNQDLTQKVTAAFKALGTTEDVRVIVLSGTGKSFCAGGDLNWMKRMVESTFEENLADAAEMAEMFHTIARCPKPVIARVHGAALGGGSGMVAAADIAISVESAMFGFTEVRLGIVPGVISPYVIDRIGPGRAREFFTTGEQFPARVAHSIGLVHNVVPGVEALDEAIDVKIEEFLKAAPGAIAATKNLIFQLSARSSASAIEYANEALARARASEEGQAGIQAFLNRKKPPWMKP